MNNEMMQRLEQIQEELAALAALGAEAAEIFQENSPSLHDQGEAYGAFEFGTSSNPYDTTLASLIESAQEEEFA